MTKVGVMINNSAYGLHDGHKAVLEFARQFGEVNVELVENMADRNAYLLHGNKGPKYKIKLDKMEKDCKDLGIKLHKPVYIDYTEAERNYYYRTAKQIVEDSEARYPMLLLSDRFRKQMICSLMAAPARRKAGLRTDVAVFGPDVLSYAFYRITKKVNDPNDPDFIRINERSEPIVAAASRVELFDTIIKDKYGLKLSTSGADVPFEKRRLSSAIYGARKHFQMGRNDELVAKLNRMYATSFRWRWHEINLYPREGKTLELVTVSVINEKGQTLFDNIDYY